MDAIHATLRVNSLNPSKYTGRKEPFIIKSFINGHGYEDVVLKDRKHHLIHRIVAKTFLENPNNKPEVNHKDRNRLNNNISNLEWCTKLENIRHAINLGSYKDAYEKKLILKIKELKKEHNFILIDELINYLEEMLDNNDKPLPLGIRLDRSI